MHINQTNRAKISLDNEIWPGPYPPQGTVELKDTGDGAGNYYALYWPIGKEDEQPYVCWIDEGQPELRFPSIASFTNKTEQVRGAESIDGEERELHYGYLNQAKRLFRKGALQEALEHVEYAISLFEGSVINFRTQANILLRLQEYERAAEAAESMLLANWTFEGIAKLELDVVNNITTQVKPDWLPILSRYEALNFNARFDRPTYFNYKIWREVIDDYHERDEYVKSARALHNYGSALGSRSRDIRQEFGFDLEDWRSAFKSYTANYVGNRQSIVFG